MNYQQSKFLGKIMWIVYILIGLFAISHIIKEQNKLPVIEDVPSYEYQNNDIYYAVIDNEDISTQEDISQNKRSYIYKVEILEDLNSLQYDKIAKEVVNSVKSSVKKQDKNISVENIEIEFVKDNKVVNTHLYEE